MVWTENKLSRLMQGKHRFSLIGDSYTGYRIRIFVYIIFYLRSRQFHHNSYIHEYILVRYNFHTFDAHEIQFCNSNRTFSSTVAAYSTRKTSIHPNRNLNVIIVHQNQIPGSYEAMILYLSALAQLWTKDEILPLIFQFTVLEEPVFVLLRQW